MENKCSVEEHFFGSVTVGERGQVVIPAEARKKMGISPGDKLLVMGHPYGNALVLAKIDSMREVLTTFQESLQGWERTLELDSHDGVLPDK
ncbi:MAG: AbrB/MazE/SpoVT family DNA-binding domain-containing protein [Armatimonadota bacterium]